jgi:hypothetical protein
MTIRLIRSSPLLLIMKSRINWLLMPCYIMEKQEEAISKRGRMGEGEKERRRD